MYTEITNAAAENKCPEGKGQLPGRCAAMAFPFVAMQGQDPKRYDQREALQQGTLFPGLDLPFHKELKSRFPAANTALSELMALDFAIDELGLYLVTHAEDQENCSEQEQGDGADLQRGHQYTQQQDAQRDGSHGRKGFSDFFFHVLFLQLL